MKKSQTMSFTPKSTDADWGPLPFPFKEMHGNITLHVEGAPQIYEAMLDVERDLEDLDRFSTVLILNHVYSPLHQLRVRLPKEIQSAIRKSEPACSKRPFVLHVPASFFGELGYPIQPLAK
jgi:hypothetical protein